MWTEEDFQWFISVVKGDDPAQRAVSLRVHYMTPSGDPRILPYLEALLTDVTPCLLMLPYMFGEIRWLAARALAVERATIGIDEPVKLAVARPLTTGGVAALAEEVGLERRHGYGVEGLIGLLGDLLDMGKVPMVTLELDPVKIRQDLALRESHKERDNTQDE